MTTFTVWRFDDSGGADRAADLLGEISTRGAPQVVDHAVVSWPVDEPSPVTRLSHADAKQGATWGTLWDVVADAVLTVPVIGGVVGTAMGARAANPDGVAVSRRDVARIQAAVTPGSSALFLVTEDGDADLLGDELGHPSTTLLHTSVSS